MSPNPAATPRLPFPFAKRHRVFVSKMEEGVVHLTHQVGIKPTVLMELRRHFGCALMTEALPADEFETQLARAYESGTDNAFAAMTGLEADLDLNQLVNELPKPEDLLESEDEAPVIRLLNAILTQAIKQGASDIHVETFEDRLLIRYRIDGVLREVLVPPRVLAPLITSRLKIMAKLDIAEKRLPQDGRISLRIAGRAVDVRVSTIPTHYGERIVLRLLDKQSTPLDLARLGMAPDTLTVMERLIAQPHGIILVTGPTGSGKTTTLYAALTSLNQESRNILTVEDPIEYYLPGIGQTQVNSKIGMTFAKGLRAILRQDPDVVMVGEIRDIETVDMAIQASLTGHLVLSTLHTNSAIGAITRLRDMGAEPFLLSSTIIGVAAQRLVRLLCRECRQATPVTPEERALIGDMIPQPVQTETGSQTQTGAKKSGKTRDAVVIYHAVGCDACNQLGYSGRTGIYELIAVDERLRAMIHSSESEATLEDYARQASRSMRQDGWRRVLAGETTIEEVLRVTAADV